MRQLELCLDTPQQVESTEDPKGQILFPGVRPRLIILVTKNGISGSHPLISWIEWFEDTYRASVRHEESEGKMWDVLDTVSEETEVLVVLGSYYFVDGYLGAYTLVEALNERRCAVVGFMHPDMTGSDKELLRRKGMHLVARDVSVENVSHTVKGALESLDRLSLDRR